MQQNEFTKKFVQLWNDQALDTHHDIIVSVDYALFNYNDIPSCGFCIALFESINDKPRGGGENYSLAYTPNESENGCQSNNSRGLEYAVYGIGFDPSGIFAKRTPYVEGVDYTVANSICLRDGIKNDYQFLKQSENLLYPHNFEIAQQKISAQDETIFKQVRVVFSKCMSKLRVDIKKDEEREFTQIFEYDLPILNKKSVKVGLFYTSKDQDSKFLLKQFNVAGFPAEIPKEYDLQCFQEIKCSNELIGNKLPSNENWIIAPYYNGFDLFKFDGKEFYGKQRIRSTTDLEVLNHYENLIYTKSNNKLIVYNFKGNNLIKEFTISLPTSDDITSCAGYGDTLVISSSSSGENYYVYNYVRDSSNLSEIGTWRYYQTFNYSLCSGFGTNIEMSENYILSYSTNNCIVSFKKDPDFGYQYHQTIAPPYSGAKGFGYSMSISNDNELIVGAPFGEKRYIYGDNQGEVFHYVLFPTTQNWELISEIGQYFNMDTLSGAFGYSVKIKDNTVVVGSPFETFYISDYPLVDVSKQGKTYLFKKDEQGYFTNRIIYYPPSALGNGERNYGKQVNLFGNGIAVGMPFLSDDTDDVIDIYNVGCPALSAPLPKPSQTPTLPPTPTPTSTPQATPQATPSSTPQATPASTPQATPLPNLGIISFTNEQMDSFNNENMYPFDGGMVNGLIMFNMDSITQFNGDLLYPFT